MTRRRRINACLEIRKSALSRNSTSRICGVTSLNPFREKSTSEFCAACFTILAKSSNFDSAVKRSPLRIILHSRYWTVSSGWPSLYLPFLSSGKRLVAIPWMVVFVFIGCDPLLCVYGVWWSRPPNVIYRPAFRDINIRKRPPVRRGPVLHCLFGCACFVPEPVQNIQLPLPKKKQLRLRNAWAFLLMFRSGPL